MLGFSIIAGSGIVAGLCWLLWRYKKNSGVKPPVDVRRRR